MMTGVVVGPVLSVTASEIQPMDTLQARVIEILKSRPGRAFAG